MQPASKTSSPFPHRGFEEPTSDATIAAAVRAMSHEANPDGQFGKYTCNRCGWKWTPRHGRPDPPRACARCRSAYWQSAPVTRRANRPDDPKWREQRELIMRHREERQLAKLRDCAAEFGLKLSPMNNQPLTSTISSVCESGSPPINPSDHSREPVAPSPPYPPTAPSERRPLAEELARLTAEWKQIEERVPPPSARRF